MHLDTPVLPEDSWKNATSSGVGVWRSPAGEDSLMSAMFTTRSPSIEALLTRPSSAATSREAATTHGRSSRRHAFASLRTTALFGSYDGATATVNGLIPPSRHAQNVGK